MASACPSSLAIAIANAGGLGGCGALMMQPEAIRKWAADVRAGTNGGFQFNLWIPDPPPKRDAAAEAAVRDFLANWGPPVPPEAGNVVLPDFQAQCDALLEASPAFVSSIMGLYPDRFVARMKTKGIKWFATVTTVSEAKTAERAGADAIIAQGMEAGGHRSAFDVTQAETRLVGLFSLISGVVDAVNIPVVATGGIADGRAIAAALLLGASAVQIGTAFLRCPEAQIPSAWAYAIGKAAPEDTVITRTMTGRPPAASPPSMCALRWHRRRHRQRPIPCNAASPSPCAKRLPKRTMSPGCKPGPVSPPDWRGQNPPAKSFTACGTKPKLYWASCLTVDPRAEPDRNHACVEGPKRRS